MTPTGSFPDNTIHTIVPDSSITTEMINMARASFNTSFADFVSSTDPQNPMKMIKFKPEFSAPFVGFPWFNKIEILVELDKDEWK